MNLASHTLASETPFAAAPESTTGPVAAPAGEAAVPLTLDRLGPDLEAVVDAVDGEPVVRRRLLEAGFVPGSRVRFLMSTPFGDPLVFSLRGTCIALRRTDARHVRVRS